MSMKIEPQEEELAPEQVDSGIEEESSVGVKR
jgi:hypothetical protein